jgi:hypothetical protein
MDGFEDLNQKTASLLERLKRRTPGTAAAKAEPPEGNPSPVGKADSDKIDASNILEKLKKAHRKAAAPVPQEQAVPQYSIMPEAKALLTRNLPGAEADIKIDTAGKGVVTITVPGFVADIAMFDMTGGVAKEFETLWTDPARWDKEKFAGSQPDLLHILLENRKAFFADIGMKRMEVHAGGGILGGYDYARAGVTPNNVRDPHFVKNVLTPAASRLTVCEKLLSPEERKMLAKAVKFKEPGDLQRIAGAMTNLGDVLKIEKWCKKPMMAAIAAGQYGDDTVKGIEKMIENSDLPVGAYLLAACSYHAHVDLQKAPEPAAEPSPPAP